MKLSIQITEGHELAFDFASIAAAERAFEAIRAVPVPVYVDELEPYIDQVTRAAAGGEALAA